jgi:hypothetical protein
MRRTSWLALLVVAAVTALACAHPTEDPLPGETLAQPSESAQTASPSPSHSTGPTSGSSDPVVTRQVCEDAQDVTKNAVDQIMSKISQAQSNPTAAIASVIIIGEQWKSKLKDFRDKAISAPVRDVLDQGIDLIDDLLHTLRTNPTSLVSQANQIQDQIDGFKDDLASACD